MEREFILKAFNEDGAEYCIKNNMQEVVRCKDCVYAISDPYGMSYTTLCMDTSDDHYCWWGERKENA